MNFTLQDFKNAVKGFYTIDSEPKREFVAYTGERGMKMLNDAMQVEIYRPRRRDAKKAIYLLHKTHKITTEQWRNMKHMIDSPDHENLVVVEAIIEQYNNNEKT